MKTYQTADIRNVALFGHGSSGKTTLVEAMALVSGAVSRQGKVTDGNTLSDFDKEETKRGFSISTSVIPIEWKGKKINILDTPGFFDFVGEVEEAASAADAAVIVVNAKAGVQVGAQKAWNICKKLGLPRLIYVSGMDDANADFDAIADQLKSVLGSGCTPFQLPIRENDKLAGIADIATSTGIKFTGAKGESAACDIPGDISDDLESRRSELMEAAAATSEELMERFFNDESFTAEEIAEALSGDVAEGSTVPVLLGNSIAAQGVPQLLDTIVNYLPSPAQCTISGTDTKTGDAFDADYDDSKPLSAKVFKTLIDPFIGKYSFIKICSGVMKSDSAFYNVQTETDEKISRLYILRGKEAIEVPELHAGDIGALSKMNNASTGDTLATKALPVAYPKPDISTPYLYMAYSAKNKGDVDKLATALGRICEEDKTIRLVNDSQNHQSLIYGIGDQQLDTIVSKVLTRYKVEMELAKPKIAYRETIRKPVQNVQGRHKKQTGGAGQFGEVFMNFEPSGDLETPYIFEDKVVGGSVPKNFFPAVEKGVAESVQRGPLAGYPVYGIRATLVDGKYHPVDSNEMAFKMASIKAFKEGIMQANPILLEPIASLRVVVPNDFMGDVMGDLNKRRGRVLGSEPTDDGRTTVIADIPMSELHGYTTTLRSMTGGIGEFSYEFARYEQAPSDVQQREMDAREADADE